MTSPLLDTALSSDSYLALGLATCFIKRDGKLTPVQVLEPIPSAALEAIIKGIPTSYSKILGVSLGQMTTDPLQVPPDFAPEAQLCDEFSDRVLAAARTYGAKPVAANHVPLGTICTDLNFSVERKRVLNSERLVTAEDNVKQHAYTHQIL
ncbi:hypothetical protein RIF25_12365 [Thermosynechococcaceae cyanobacterium BACA0444]|uniref:Uncharacterized protein n=1 Tax=Pseudocalidococcus azoricus BACA0444 TaxID=2918990 RepID=A0AAE4JZ12_9CYAN|nr:hypothetical protein [Pseudocalidococcus azoricus]MDS3861599.1 hypothetical protein [Pseudocalidococcus azoricus BACA0444]